MPNRDPLPDLPDSLQWLNAQPVKLRELRGRVVVLAFVSATSAWCWQRINEVAQWQARFPGRLAALVVNVPRFDFERNPQAAFALWRRQNIDLPLAHDNDWIAWQRFGIEAWPTLLLIDAEGQLRAQAIGEEDWDELEKTLLALCDRLPESLDDQPKNVLKPIREPLRTLRFPTALAANEEALFIADTGHHRVFECTHNGRVLRRFGLGAPDFLDGEGEHAGFHSPQGLALSRREWLYVADAGNHAVRRISLRTGSVDTLVGSGKCGTPVEGKVDSPRSVSLAQPQGLYANDNEVLVALAGDNRIWGYDLLQHTFTCRAGSGALEIKDGTGTVAAFAQPMAMAAQPPTLYVADGLASALRTMHLRNDLVQTLVGSHAWDSGDADGGRAQARMQYPVALAVGAERLWIADAGNGRVRTLRIGGGELETVRLPMLSGIAGLAFGAGKLFISEADMHGIHRYDPATGMLEQLDILEE